MLSPVGIKTFRIRKGYPHPLPDMSLSENSKYVTNFTRSERRVFRRQKIQNPSIWAPKNRKIVKGDLAGNYMNLDITPHLRGIMDAAVLPYIRETIICAAPQTAKTTGIDTIIAWTRIFAKGPACSFYPDETTAKRSMKDRIAPMVKQSPALKRQVSRGRDSYTATGIEMVGGEWEVGWVGSVAQTADRSIKYVDMQEVNKPSYGVSKDETSPIALLRKRVRAYGDTGKLFMSSSPTTTEGNITQLLEHECEAVFVQWVTCPYCHNEVFMSFSKERFWWPTGDDGKSIDRKTIKSKKLARYVCQECGERWDDNDRDKAIRREVWRLRITDKDGGIVEERGEEMFRYLARNRPATIGLIMPSWLSYFVSLSEVAHDFLRSVDKDLSPEERFKALKDFRNGHEALPWKVEIETKPVDQILAFCDDRPEGRIPGGERVASVLAAIDTQDGDLFYLSIWAIGWGFMNEQWLVLRKPIDSFEAIAKTLWASEYFDMDGQRYHIEHTFIDMLGHRTKEVLEFCIQYEGFITPIYGSSRAMTQGYVFSQKEYMPGSDQPIPGGGIRSIRMNTKYYKDNMAIKLSLAPDTPGCIHLYADVGEDYCKQLTSEARDEKGNWQQIGSRANHYWDNWCAVNCLADYLGVKHRIRPDMQGDIEIENDNIVVANSQFMGG